MTSIKSENFDELCRLCASYDAIKMDIFGDRGRERKLLEKIHTCLPFHVSEEDSLPKSLCYRCIYNLENFYDFRKGCVDAVSRLENFVSDSDVDIRKVTTRYDAASEDDNNSVISVRSDYSDSQEPNPADFLEARMDNEPMQTSRNENHVTEQVIEVNAGSFACPACPKSFSNMSALIIHSKLHMAGGSASVSAEKKDLRMFPCPVCEKTFISKGNLSNHVKIHSYEPNTINRQPRETNTVRPFQCELCSKTYVVAKHLWGHVSTSHRGDPRVTCPYCSRTFSTPANLEEHKRSKHLHQIGSFQEVEENSMTIADSISIDESQDSGEAVGKSVSEEFCGSRRKNTKPRKIAREHSNDTDNCNSYSHADTEEESIVVNELSNRSCLLCAKTFSNRSGLRRHLYNVHGLDPNEVEAQNVAMQDIMIKKEMEESEMVESLVEAETVFCCEVCVREFNDRASLWLHMLYSHREEAATACGICLQVCSDNVSLLEHIHSCHPKESLGSEKRRYSCQICARQHDSRKKLVAHVKIHNLQDEDGQALDPESLVILNNDFYGHDQSLRNDDDFSLSCEVCYKSFPSENKLMKHKRNAHKDSQKLHSLNSSNTYHSYFSCELCGLSHATRTERWKHVFRCHSDEPSLVCELPDCGKVFPTRALKIEHASTHHQQQGDMPNTCEICGNIWATRINYWKHMMGVHRDSLPFICGVCLKIFVSIPDLASHVQQKHKADGPDFCCDICGRPYTKKSKMSRHRKIHNIPFSEGGLQEGQFESQAKGNRGDDSLLQLRCEECPTEEFLDLEELSEHRRSAHNLVPCDLCPKYYGRTSHLWKHVNKIHKGHTDITCSICLRTSASRVHLSKHFAKHHRALTSDNVNWHDDVTNNSTEESVHTCTKCLKIFRKDHLMQQHLKHCTGPRSTPVSNTSSSTVNGTFQCEKCNKVCETRSSLHKHIKVSHIMYPCELCEDESKNELFDTKTKLFDHILKAHHNHPDLTCDVPNCFKMLRLKKDLLKHRREHRQGYPTPSCDFCGELITNRIKLRKHLKSNHPEHSKWVCYVCAGVEESYEQLGIHIKEHHPMLVGKPTICPICAKRCTTRYKLLAHIKIHGDEFSLCEACWIIFQNKEEFNEHCKTHVKDEDEVDASELDESGIKRKHSGIDERSPKKFKYDRNYENKEFKPCVMIPNKSILDSSLDSSTYSNPYSTAGICKNRKVYEGDDADCICELCGRIWASKNQLWQHLIRSHTTDAATACGVCLKMCNNYVNLDMHLIKKHPDNFVGEGNHLNCRICGKFHPYYAKLLNHIAIHVGEEKRAQDLIFACSVCNIIFENQTILCQHNVDNHKDMILLEEDEEDDEEEDEEVENEEQNLHQCEVCDEILEGMDLFLEHSRKHRLENDNDTRISEEENTNLTADDEPKYVDHTFSEVEDQDLDPETDQIINDENLTNSSNCKDSVEDNVESILSDDNTIFVQRTEDRNNVDQISSNNFKIKEENVENNVTVKKEIIIEDTNSIVPQFVSDSKVIIKKCDEQRPCDSVVKNEINVFSSSLNDNSRDMLQVDSQHLSRNISEQGATDLGDVLKNQTTELNLMEV